MIAIQDTIPKTNSDNKFALITKLYNKTETANKYQLKFTMSSPLSLNSSAQILSIDLSNYATQSYAISTINNFGSC
jgi:hypothetical protein